jgi:hypothetical protein
LGVHRGGGKRDGAKGAGGWQGLQPRAAGETGPAYADAMRWNRASSRGPRCTG